MNRVLLMALSGAMLATPAAAEMPKKLTIAWETAGLETPESALYDKASSTIYVSNIAGKPDEKDGNGYISKLDAKGKVVAQKWATGFDAPKGLALVSGKLYAADIDKLVEIDAATGTVLKRYEAEGAKFLNDVAAGKNGDVYMSDTATNVIWRLSGGKLERWLESADLISPNGLLVEGDRLIVAAWGVMTDGMATKVPGHLLEVSLKDKSIKDIGTAPVGNLDGIEPAGDGGYFVTDWVGGKLFGIDAKGNATVLLSDLGQGSADLGMIEEEKLLLIPRMKDGKLTAFKLE